MKKNFIYFLIFVVIFALVFWSLISNISTNLIDWRDYPLIVWIINQDLSKITSLNFLNFFDTNAFYPNKNTLLFADTFLPQSLLALPFSLFSKNPIIVFNFVFISTFLLNYISSFIFWKSIFKNKPVAFLGALFVVFSPHLHLELSHFQMQSYWPLFFALYFLFKKTPKQNFRNSLLVGIFLSIQFLASVYLSVFLVAIILAHTIFRLLSENWVLVLKNALLIFVTFLLLDGIFIKGYLDTKKMYGIERQYSEFVQYSSQISDYLFTSNIQSVVHKSGIFNKWNSFDNHNGGAASAGILLTSLSILGLIKLERKKRGLKIILSINKEGLVFFFILILGLTLSLGPRLGFNGTLSRIPLPYHFFLKYAPLSDIIRAPTRWSFLFYLGTIYFALKFLNQKRRKILYLLVFFVFLIEYVPFQIPTHSEKYLTENNRVLAQICSDGPKAVLNIPVTHFDGKGTIMDGLKYISINQLASIHHKCLLINGYSGYDLPSLGNLRDNIYKSLEDSNLEDLVDLLNKTQAEIVVFNTNNLDEQSLKNFNALKPKLEKSNLFSIISDNVYQLNQ